MWKSLSMMALGVASVVVAEWNIRAAFAVKRESNLRPILDRGSKESAELRSFREAMVSNIQSQIAQKMGFESEDFDVSVENIRLEPSIPLREVKSLQVLGLGTLAGRRMEGLFNLPVSLRLGAQHVEQTIQVTGVLKVTGPVYAAKQHLPRGHVVTADDLMLVRLPWRGLPSEALGLSEKELVGHRLRVYVSSGSPLLSTTLEEPYAVKIGETVDLTVVSGPGVMIRSRGVAKQAGRLGDNVRIEQPDTRKILSGTVTGNKAVEIRL